MSCFVAESDPSPEEEEDEEEEGDTGDPFTTRLLSFQQEGGSFTPVVATRTVLRSLGPGEVSSGDRKNCSTIWWQKTEVFKESLARGGGHKRPQSIDK